MTVREALHSARQRLQALGGTHPGLEAELLLAYVLGCPRAYLYAHPELELTPVQLSKFQALLARRLRHEPLQYIIGVQEFYGRPFRVTPAVLIPRPETEHVVELALARLDRASRVLDIGCGSGAIAITVQLEARCKVWGTDISRAALEVARENARALGAQVTFVACDLGGCFCTASFDLVASNPPYVGLEQREQLAPEVKEFEPPEALFAGPSGLEFYPRLVDEARRLLRPGGWFLVELGAGQATAVQQMLGPGWVETSISADLAGIPRVLIARKG